MNTFTLDKNGGGKPPSSEVLQPPFEQRKGQKSNASSLFYLLMGFKTDEFVSRGTVGGRRQQDRPARPSPARVPQSTFPYQGTFPWDLWGDTGFEV